MKASDIYAARLQAVNAQDERIYGPPQNGDAWAGAAARQFRFDPHRDLDANLAIIASYLGPEDVFVDVGGGAGRVSLPLALRCREVVNVEPSPAMRAEFLSLAQEAGIPNARLAPTALTDAEGARGAVAFAADVTYFVEDLVAFIEKMEAAASRRVMITVWSEPPPNRSAKLFRLVYGEDQARLCGHRELLAVLWEMGILPDLRVLPEQPWWEREAFPTREEALQQAASGRWLRPEDQDRARQIIESNFDQFLVEDSLGFRPLWRSDMRELLITWETRQG